MNLFQRIKARFTTTGKYIFGPLRALWARKGTLINEEAAMKVAAFHRGVVYISTQVAKLPWDIKDKDNNILADDPVSKLLNIRPNTEMTAFLFKLFAIQNAIIHGNSYSEIERDILGRPINLWPLESRRMELERDVTGRLWYRYSDPTQGTVWIDPRNILHIKNFHTKDGLVGQGLAAYGQDVLGIQIAADQMASGIFFNGGIPSGIISHPGKLSPEGAARLKQTWNESSGESESGGTRVLEEGAKYETVKIDPEALQFLESRQFGVLEIARFLGVPPTKLFDVTAATYSNVENANLEVATDTLHTWAVNMEQEVDVKLLNNQYNGRYSEIDLYFIFRGDMDTRSKYFKEMVGIAAMTPNQARKLEGLPGYGPLGDKYYIATNNFTPVDRMNEVIDADIKQKTMPKPGPTETDKKLKEAAAAYLTGPSV